MAAVRITVRAKPRAKRSGVLRADGLAVDIAIAAPPVDGAANEELLAVVAAALSLPKRAVRLAKGASSKNKLVEVEGLEPDEVARRLGQAMAKKP